jgi:retinol-binding protein 3
VGRTPWNQSGRAINPYSKTDWEGTGVEPGVKGRALKTAHLMALEKQLPTVKDPDLKQAAGAAIEKLKKEVADNS